MIEVCNYGLSPCGEKVHFALAEKGLSSADHPVYLGSKEKLKPDFLRISLKGLVPAPGVDRVALVESTVINEFIDDTWPTPPLKPTSPHQRARMRMRTKHVDEVLHPAWLGIAWPILLRPAWLAKGEDEVNPMLGAPLDPLRRERQSRLYRPGISSPEAKASFAMLSKTCDQIQAAMAQDTWLAGPAFSLADIALLPYLYAAELFGLRSLPEKEAARRWQSGMNSAAAQPSFNGHPPNLFYPARMAEVAAKGQEVMKFLCN